MMDDTNPYAPAAALPETESTEHTETPAAEAAPAPAVNAPSAAVERFKSCRWRCTPDQGEFCTHRDVLPFAGKEGFSADSWCPECAFYKLRRTPKKRERVDYTY